MALTTLPPVWIMSLNRLFFFWTLPLMKVNFGVDSYEFDQNECVSKQKINFVFNGYSNKEQVKCFQIYVNLT